MINRSVLFAILCFFSVFRSLLGWELAVACMFKNEANYLKEWVEYHKLVGVDHFILYDNSSIDNWKRVLEPYIISGLVEVLDWTLPENTYLFPDWQVNAFKDALHRLKGKCKWLAFIDVDEFILPNKTKTVTQCLNRCFPDASAIFVHWRSYGTAGISIPAGKPILHKLCRSSDIGHPDNVNGKTIVKVEDAYIEGIWHAHYPLLKNKDMKFYNGSGERIFFRTDHSSWLDGGSKHASNFLQLNHYKMRDENFFWSRRLPTPRCGNIDKKLLEEQYESFNKIPNNQMVNFLRKWHRSYYHNYWLASD